MKKKYLSRAISALLALGIAGMMGAPALAENAEGGGTAGARSAFSMTGKVVMGKSVSLNAPYGGKILDYAARVGDVVKPGDTPFTIETTKLYAPCDGTVSGLRAQPGDEAAYLQNQYGALLYVEPLNLLKVETNTSDAYNENENKIIHAGETVYLRSVNSNSRTGIGYVTQVDGNNFSVEITSGNLRLAERAYIYRSVAYVERTRIGSGKTVRQSDVAITGEGSVLSVLVMEGQQVKRGDVLAEMVSGVLPGYTAQLTEGIAEESFIASIAVEPGSQVAEGQVLATLYPVQSLKIAADLNEMDIERIKAGDQVLVQFDGLKESGLSKGMVTAISYLSHTDSGDAEYKVYVDFPVSEEIREGMSVTVYLSE